MSLSITDREFLIRAAQAGSREAVRVLDAESRCLMIGATIVTVSESPALDPCGSGGLLKLAKNPNRNLDDEVTSSETTGLRSIPQNKCSRGPQSRTGARAGKIDLRHEFLSAGDGVCLAAAPRRRY